MVFFVKSILYTNMAIQRKCLNAMNDFLKNGEELLDKKEKFFKEIFPKAQASEEKLENLMHDTAFKVFGSVKPASLKDSLGKAKKSLLEK